MPLAVITALLACALFGLVVERILVASIRGARFQRLADGYRRPPASCSTMFVLFTFGKEPRGFPSPLASQSLKIFGTGVLSPATGHSPCRYRRCPGDASRAAQHPPRQRRCFAVVQKPRLPRGLMGDQRPSHGGGVVHGLDGR